MRCSALLVIAVTAGVARADRLDFVIPKLELLEPLHHLDRGEAKKTTSGVIADAAVGYGREDDRPGMAAEGSVALGMRLRQLAVAGKSELVAGGNDFVRGRHSGWLELRSDPGAPSEDIGGILVIAGSLEHGKARGLAPVEL